MPLPLASSAICAAVTAVVLFSRVVLLGVDHALVEGLNREKYRLSAVWVPVFCSHRTVALFEGSMATLGTTVAPMVFALAVPISSTAVAALCQALPLKTVGRRWLTRA